MIDESFILLLRNTNKLQQRGGGRPLRRGRCGPIRCALGPPGFAWCRRQHTTQPNHQLNN